MAYQRSDICVPREGSQDIPKMKWNTVKVRGRREVKLGTAGKIGQSSSGCSRVMGGKFGIDEENFYFKVSKEILH